MIATYEKALHLTKIPGVLSDSTPSPEVGWSIDKGLVRENNEDSLAAVTLNPAGADSQAVGVYAVADGMGGHQGGEVASNLAIQTAIDKLMSDTADTHLDTPESYQQWLQEAMSSANQVVQKKAHEEDLDMGTTLVMAVVVGNDVYIGNVGDSRAYLISPTSIRQITHDQSLVQALVDSGAITPEQAMTYPARNVLSQALGMQDEIMVDLFTERLETGESLLLCSDGVWGMLDNDEILQIVQVATTPGSACQALVDACNRKGGRDNMAVVLIRPASAVSQP